VINDPENTAQPPRAGGHGRADDLTARYQEIAGVVCGRLAKNQQVRRNLPGNGRLRIDRQLPFLCVYRKPHGSSDPGTRRLVTTEAAYLFGSGNPRHHNGIMLLCRRISSAMQEHFGTFLIIEVWANDENPTAAQSSGQAPVAFEIVSPDIKTIPSTVETLESALAKISIAGQPATITNRVTDSVGPAGLQPLDAACGEGCCVLGLSVAPFYRSRQSSAATAGSGNAVFPMVLHSLRRSLATAFRKTVSQFAGANKQEDDVADATAFHTLGPSSLVKAARLVDQQLCGVSESFDFLLQVTPVNAIEARKQFQESGYSKLPTLQYRPLPYHPNLLKRQLFDIEIERIEDPTLAHLFWEKQNETDRQLSALRDLGTPGFLYSSLQLYGDVDPPLRELSHQILNRFPENPAGSGDTSFVDAQQMTARARDEIDYYHSRMNEFNAVVETCDEIAAGIMVSQDRLLVSEHVSIAEKRVNALLHHEIGTHLLTYFNGRCQPFRQLYAGLCGYEELQEGLAVLAECLVGGMTSSRARTLAGRIVAADAVTNGLSFADAFAQLRQQYGFTDKRAFNITLRVYRGGGFTKDIIYLRGLKELMQYLAAGHDIEPLYVGKIGLQHVPYIQEMRRRKIIVPPRILPRFWDDTETRDRLETCRGMSVLQLLETSI